MGKSYQNTVKVKPRTIIAVKAIGLAELGCPLIAFHLKDYTNSYVPN